MVKNVIKYILAIITTIVIISIIVIIYYFSNKSREEISTKEKIDQEISYLDRRLISVINSLNNLDTEFLITSNEITAYKQNSTQSNDEESTKKTENENTGSNSSSGASSKKNDESSTKNGETITVTTINPKSILTRNKEEIDWQYINNTLEEINNSWTIITIDLKSIDIPNNDLLEFGNNIDVALKYTKINDKTNSLISIANLYSLIPKYESSYSNESNNIELKYIKSDIVSSYALLNTGRWSEMLPLLNDADTRMSRLINSADNNQSIQKKYIQLKEYIKSVNDMDVDLCYMKYYYLIKDWVNWDGSF